MACGETTNKSIVLACLYNNETNCGDKIYVETFLELMRRYSRDVSVEICDFYGRVPAEPRQGDVAAGENIPRKPTLKARIAALLPRFLQAWVREYSRRKKIRKYYEKQLLGADVLIFPGGGLVECPSWRDYYWPMKTLEKICSRMSIPVVLNSIGYVENKPSARWFRRWRRILNNPGVVHVTCRDNLPVFQELNERVVQIPCMACISADVLGVARNDDGSNTVGVGLMRYDCFSDFGNDVGKDFILNYYKDVIVQLRSLGYNVSLFSVGVKRDQRMGEEILSIMKEESLSLEGVSIMPRPVLGRTMLEQMARFRGILTVRTHSAYTAFSLDIPAVMFYFGKRGWEGKAREFMAMMGRPENAVCCDGLSPKALVERFQRAMEEGWEQNIRMERKKACYSNFLAVMDKIGVRQSTESTADIGIFS